MRNAILRNHLNGPFTLFSKVFKLAKSVTDVFAQTKSSKDIFNSYKYDEFVIGPGVVQFRE